MFSWVSLFVAGGFNGIYLRFHGIRRFDRYFSTLPDFEQESYSPFDRFCRMHRYSFLYTLGLSRSTISSSLAVWLYFTCFSLTVFWISMVIGQLKIHFGFNPLARARPQGCQATWHNGSITPSLPRQYPTLKPLPHSTFTLSNPHIHIPK